MQLSTDIMLPKEYAPRFPNKCIVCHRVPDSTIKLAHNSQNPFLAFFIPILFFFGWSRVEAPICRECKPRFRIQRWGRQFGGWVIILVAMWFIYPYFKDWSPLWRKISVCGLALLVFAPYALLETIWPPVFDTTARSKSIDYEFASPEYAEEFHELNEERILQQADD